MVRPLFATGILKPILDLLTKFAPPGSRWLAILEVVIIVAAVLIPVLAIIGAWLFLRWKKKKDAEKETAAPVDTKGPAVGGQQVQPQQLRKAWRRFADGLPPVYQRSILNFEHFIVLGATASGKSRFIDAHTDWRRQAKQFLESQSYDADLQVYLASNAVVMEIPARILEDHSEKVHTALRNLWEPLYKKRAPTVVVVADAMGMKDSSPETVADLAETIRGKVNVLSALRKRRIEVRVAISRLDELEGYAEFAAFCHREGISTRIPLLFGELAPTPRAQLEAWLDGMRGHLPRALAHLPASEFRRVVAFLRRAPEVVPQIAHFLTTLYAHEALSLDPASGGVYLVSVPPGVANPLRSAAERGPGPDPRRPHLIAATVTASLILSYLIAAYREQSALWAPAAQAMEEYQPAAAGNESERRRREAIAAFTHRGRSWVETRPDFFAKARLNMRKRFSDRVRDDLLVPKLKSVAERGTIREGMTPLPTRRSLYYLALIHSSSTDGFKILQPSRLEVWSSMTGLDPDLIRDYLKNTETAYRWPVEHNLRERADDRDTPGPWVELLRSVKEQMTTGVIRPAELRALQARAAQAAETLDRYEHDDITAAILDHIDEAAGTADSREPSQVELKAVYYPRYSEFLRGLAASDLLAQRNDLRALLATLKAGSIDVSEPPLLKGLVDRLAALYAIDAARDPDADKEISLRLGNVNYTFDPKRWRELIRDSAASEQISQYLKTHGQEGSVFFGREEDAELRPILWNPTNDGSALFTGKGSIEGRYTRTGYERRVRDVVIRLTEVLEKSKVPEEQKRGISEFTRDQVRRYASEYRSQLMRFHQSFGLRAPSHEALRVALSQMASDTSVFNEFLLSIDRNSNLEFGNPLLEPMRDAVADYANWHHVVDAGGAAPELAKYKAVLAQLLTDLSAPDGEIAADPAAPPGDTLEKSLSPAGRKVLVALRGEKGSYSKLITDWLASVHLPPWQEGPFLAPLEQMTAFGRRDIERVIARAWERDMLPDVLHIVEKFPFDPEAQLEVTPKELAAVLHPVNGRFFDFFRRFIEPLSEFDKGGPFRERGSIRGNLAIPADLYPTVNAAAALSSRLWDPTGKPLPLTTRIATVPFPHGPDPRFALTLIYLNAGEASVFNFNQQPSLVSVAMDWTKETNSQVGVQLTDLDTKENTFPDPVVAQGSFWSLLRLLKKGDASAMRVSTGTGTLYTWDIKLRRDSADKIPARFVVLDNPWDTFTLGKTVRARLPKAAKIDG